MLDQVIYLLTTKKFELKVLVMKYEKKYVYYLINFKLSTPSLSSIYNLDRFAINMIFKNNKKQKASAETIRKAK